MIKSHQLVVKLTVLVDILIRFYYSLSEKVSIFQPIQLDNVHNKSLAGR